MKLTKRILAATCAMALACGMAACGSSSASDESSAADVKEMNDSQKAQVSDLASQLPDVQLENKEIKWLAHYDINPGDGQVEDPGLALFKEKYDGSIKYIQTTWDNRYTDLAKSVLAKDSPDFFPADDMDAFPKGAIKAMFEPIDDYVDLDSELWAPSKTTSDAFLFNGKHYVAVIDTTPALVCVYNTKTIEDNGLDDPAELYANDEWTWSNFSAMCEEFTDADADKYALDGYWYTKALNDTCGVPLITLEDGKLKSNLENPEVAKVQDLMYNLQKKGVVYPRCDNNWSTRGSGATGEGLGSNLTLFIPTGLWAIESADTKLFGDIKNGEIMFVPMPRMDDSDKYYVSSRVNGYLLCNNAPNPEGFAAYMNCLQVTNQKVSDIHIQQLKDEYGWNDTMVDMRNQIYDLCDNGNAVFDFQEGVSAELSTTMMTVNQATMISGGGETTWTACVAENGKAVDYLIKEANSNISATPTDK